MVRKFLGKEEISKELGNSKHLLVAVSGGADSMFLLLALHALKDEFNWTLSVAHLNHGLRSEIADEEEEFVRAWSEVLGLDFYVERADIRALNKLMKKGEEAAGRQARYDFFQELAEKIDADALVLGHHQDDQVESFFLRLIRGTSPQGLLPLATGLALNEKTLLFRPLLDYRQRDIKELLDRSCINYCEDESNYADYYKRSLIRQELLPFLEKENPKINLSIKSLQKLLADDQEFINHELEKRLVQLSPDPFNFLSAEIQKMKNWPKSLLSRWLNNSFYQIAGNQEGIQFIHIEEVLSQIYKNPSFWQFSLPQGIIAMISCDRFFLLTAAQGEFLPKLKPNWPLPERENLPWLRDLAEFSCQLKIEEISWEERKRGGVFSQRLWENFSEFDLRTFQLGDKIRIKGNQSKKLSDYFQERRVPIPWRRSMPLLTQEDKIILIPDHYCNQLYQPADREKCYHLSFVLEN